MGLYDGGVDHLHSVYHNLAGGQSFQQHVSQP
jgi:hypothetical protein